MNKSDITRFLHNVQMSVTRHSPEILTGIGIAGLLTTTVLAVKATPKAIKVLEEEKRNRELDREHGVDEQHAPVDISRLDAVKLCWKYYIPAAVTAVASTSCLILASSVHMRRNAALATAYKLSETALTEYREKVIETVGEKKEQAVRDKIAKDHIDKNPPSKNEVFITKQGDTLCYDYVSKRYFKSDLEQLRKIENDLNKEILHDICGCVSLNDFYNEIGLEQVAYGDDMGWNTENLLDLDISSHISEDGKPCLLVGHYNAPRYNYC
jgi:hypothetical protein